LVLAVLASSGVRPLASLALKAAAAFIFTVGTIWPGTLRRVSCSLRLIAPHLGRMVGSVLLATFVFALIAPLALLLRLIKRDPLSRRLGHEAALYWQPRFRMTDHRRYFRQF
jgi:hypothetical protein